MYWESTNLPFASDWAAGWRLRFGRIALHLAKATHTSEGSVLLAERSERVAPAAMNTKPTPHDLLRAGLALAPAAVCIGLGYA